MARRAARAAMRRVDAMFSARGPAFKQLATSWAANIAGDTLVAVALAGTLFFDVPTTEARDRVALYLALTLAPFAVIAPVLGGVFARFPMYRAAMTLSAMLRMVLAVVMMFGLETNWLFPIAFGMLVLSRLYGISKSSMLPVAVPEAQALVSANALLARIGIYAGAIALPLGAAVAQLAPWLALVIATAVFGISSFLSLGLPDPRAAAAAAGVEVVAPSPIEPHRSIRLSRLATAGVRLINGYLLLLLAFAFREADRGALDFGAVIAAAGVGFGLASFLSPWLERRLREEPMVVAALAVEAGSAFMAAQVFGLGAAAALAAATGLAWGTAKFGFDGLLQRTVAPAKRGQAFTRAETLFQLAWVVGAIIPVTLSIDPEFGLAAAGVAALAAQTVFVAGLLVESGTRPPDD